MTHDRGYILTKRIIGFAIIFVGIIVIAVYMNTRKGDAPIAQEASSTATVSPSATGTAKPSGLPFRKTGNIIQIEGANGWFLSYEEPGKPALLVTLKFDSPSVSMCTQGTRTTPCMALSAFAVGSRVEVQGYKTGDVVTVQTMDFVEMRPLQTE